MAHQAAEETCTLGSLRIRSGGKTCREHGVCSQAELPIEALGHANGVVVNSTVESHGHDHVADVRAPLNSLMGVNDFIEGVACGDRMS